MQKHQVRTPSDALAYITDCTLATVCSMAFKKSRGKHEFERQISIAQVAVDWMQQMKIDPSSTRVKDVIAAGGVQKWADGFIKTLEAYKK